jgi:hypothetical protein
VQDHVTKSHDVGTIQYIEWLILINRVQPSFIAGVPPCEIDCGYVCGIAQGRVLHTRTLHGDATEKCQFRTEKCVEASWEVLAHLSAGRGSSQSASADRSTDLYVHPPAMAVSTAVTSSAPSVTPLPGQIHRLKGYPVCIFQGEVLS